MDSDIQQTRQQKITTVMLVGAEQVIGKDFDIKEIERVAVQLLAERLHSLE
jgi:hypothetical protein